MYIQECVHTVWLQVQVEWPSMVNAKTTEWCVCVRVCVCVCVCIYVCHMCVWVMLYLCCRYQRPRTAIFIKKEGECTWLFAVKSVFWEGYSRHE